MNNPMDTMKKQNRSHPIHKSPMRRSPWIALLGCAVMTSLFPACATTHSQFQKGYERGSSDTVKRQYWILQEMQKNAGGSGAKKPRSRLSVYRMTVTPDPNATVKSVSYEIAIPITE